MICFPNPLGKQISFEDFYKQHNEPLICTIDGSSTEIKDEILVIDTNTLTTYLYTINRKCGFVIEPSINLDSTALPYHLNYSMYCGYKMRVIPGEKAPKFCPGCGGKIHVKDNRKENK